MNQDVGKFLLSWAPMLLLIVVWVFFLWRSRVSQRTPAGETYIQLLAKQLDASLAIVEELRRGNAINERLTADRGAGGRRTVSSGVTGPARRLG